MKAPAFVSVQFVFLCWGCSLAEDNNELTSLMPSGNQDICKSLRQGCSRYHMYQLCSYTLSCGYFGLNRMPLDSTTAWYRSLRFCWVLCRTAFGMELWRCCSSSALLIQLGCSDGASSDLPPTRCSLKRGWDKFTETSKEWRSVVLFLSFSWQLLESSFKA